MMFRKLRNTFLLMNLLSISAMMVASFIVIYVVTYSGVRSDIENELRRVSDIGRRPSEFTDRLPSGSDIRLAQPADRPQRGEEPPIERSVAFVVETDVNGNVSTYHSTFNTEVEFYIDAAELVLSQNRDTGRIRLDGSQWAFIGFKTAGGLRIVFVDVSSQQAILTQLVYTFLGAAAFMLIVIFFISRHIAERAIAPIRESFDRQKRFVADASHELRTPLSVITSNTDVLLSDAAKPTGEQRKWLNHIKYESELMAKLTNDLLYLTHIDHSDEVNDYVNLDMSSVVENAVLSMDAVFYEAGLSLSHTIEPGLQCLGNRERLARVIAILLDNALKYASPDSPVCVELSRRNQTLELSVANNGGVIDPDEIDRIFDRFYRADKARSRKSGSYGLGLAIAKEIVDQHNGRIYARSNLEGETRFSVELPLSFREEVS